MSVQAPIVDLLRDLQAARPRLSLHQSRSQDSARALASEIIVMRDNKVVEPGPAAELLAEPRSAYTRALFAAAFDIKAEAGAVLGNRLEGRANPRHWVQIIWARVMKHRHSTHEEKYLLGTPFRHTLVPRIKEFL